MLTQLLSITCAEISRVGIERERECVAESLSGKVVKALRLFAMDCVRLSRSMRTD